MDVKILVNNGYGDAPAKQEHALTIAKYLMRQNYLTPQIFEEAKKEVDAEIQKENEEHRKRLKKREELEAIRKKPENILATSWVYSQRLRTKHNNPYKKEIDNALKTLKHENFQKLYEHFAECQLPSRWREEDRISLLIYLQLCIQKTAPEQQTVLEKIKNSISL